MEFPKEPTIDSSLVSFPEEDTTVSTMDIETQKRRADKYDFALGSNSPGAREILHSLTNNESAFRETKAVEYDNQFQMQREKTISEYLSKKDPSLPFDAKDLDTLRSMTKNDLADPDTFLEKAYARRITSWEDSKPQIFDNLDQVINVSPEIKVIQDRTTSLAGHKESARKLLEEYDARIKDQGWGDWLGSHAVQLMPIIPWMNTQNAFSKQSEFLKGSNIQAQVQDYYSKDSTEGLKMLREAAEKLSNQKDENGIGFENLVAARDFVKSFVEYGMQDAVLDSTFAVADIALTNTAIKTTQAMAKGLVASVSHSTPNMATRAMALGKQNDAVEITALEMIKARAGSAEDADSLFKTFPSLFNNKFYDSAMHAIPTEAARLRAEQIVVSANEEALKAMIANPSKITRLEGEAEALSRVDTVGTFQARYPSASDSILDVVHVQNTDQVTNINTLEIVLGNINKKLFVDKTHAERYAKEEYGLTSFEVKQATTSPHYYISTKVDVTENASGLYRNITIPTNRSGAVVESVVGWLKGADRNFTPEINAARRQVIYNTDIITKNVQDLTEPLRKVRKDVKFSDFLLNSHINQKTYHTASEMEQAWLKQHGSFPTEVQVKAYDTSIRIHDLAKLQENMLTRSFMAQVGIESHAFKLSSPDGSSSSAFNFLGKYRKEGLPNPVTNNYTIGVVDSRGMIAVERSNQEFRETAQGLIDNAGYRVVQLTPDAKRSLITQGYSHIDYILVKELNTKTLPFEVVKKKSGFNRVVDPETFVVSQPDVRTVNSRGVPEHYFAGDTTLLHSKDAKTAKELVDNVEIGRKLVIRNDDLALEAHLGRTMPGHLQDITEFKKLFTVNGYNINTPFMARQIKEDSFGKLSAMRTDDGMSSLFPNLQDSVRNEHNLYNELPSSGFTKDSEALGYGVTREGSDANPTYAMTREQILSPIASLERSVEDLSRSSVLEDYKIKSGRDFVNKYQSIINIPIEELRRDPFAAITDVKWITNADPVLKAQAINELRAHKNLMGIDSPALFDLKGKFYSTYQEATGNKAIPFDRFFSRVAETDPVNAMRQGAFHLTQGLFAVPTMFAQGMNVTNILAIHPKNGLQGASASIVRNLGRVFGDESTYKWVDKFLSTQDWKAGEYKEAIDAYYRSGFHKVSSNTMTDAAISPVMRQGKTGDAVDSILDAGTIPLRAGEAINRDTAWFTAYKNWKDSNPNKRFDGRAEAVILLHADNLAGQMSRASKAAWDTGIMSVATQFKSWYGRQIDLLTGDSLTTPQKLRLLTMSTALHGIAAGGVVGVAGGAVWPTGQSMSKYLNENGHDTDDIKIKAITKGLVGAATEAMLGQPYAFTEKFGPGQNDMFKLIYDGEYIKALGGPSGTLLIKSWESKEIQEGLKYVRAVITGQPSDPNIFQQELNHLVRNVRFVNDVYNLHSGLMYGKMYSKSGGTVDVSAQDAWVKMFTGMNSQTLQDTYDKGASLKDRKAFKQAAEKDITSDLTNMFKYKDNPELANRYEARALIKMDAVGFDSQERIKLMKQFKEDSVISTNLRFKKEFPKSTPLVDKTLTTYSRGNQ